MMFRRLCVAAVAVAAVVACGPRGGDDGIAVEAVGDAEVAIDVNDRAQAASYVLGYDIGGTIKMLKDLDTALNLDIVFMAIRDVTEDRPKRMDDSVRARIDAEFKQYLSERDNERRRKAAEERAAPHKKAAAEFLESNKGNEGVQVTPSGLQYIMLTEGRGASPAADDSVRVHYRGTLLDGTQFDSSYDRNEPTGFRLRNVISGWTEGLQLMKTGGKMRLFVPPDLAYGDRGMPRSPIEPGMMLIFEIELLEIVKDRKR